MNKLYAIMFEQSVDGEVSSGILGNKVYGDGLAAYDTMLADGQRVVKDWNQSPPESFRLNAYPSLREVSVESEVSDDYYRLTMTQVEVV